MKKWSTKLTALAATCLLLMSTAALPASAWDFNEADPPGNLIANGDFEDGLKHWTIAEGLENVLWPADASGGEGHSLGVAANPNWEYDPQYCTMQGFLVPFSGQYTFSAYIFSVGEVAHDFFIDSYSQNESWTENIPEGRWVEISYSLYLEQSPYTTLRILNQYDSIIIDKVTLTYDGYDPSMSLPWETPPNTSPIGNLIKNPGFEDGLQNWTLPNEAPGLLLSSPNFVCAGQNSMYIENGNLSQDIWIPEEGLYELKAYVLGGSSPPDLDITIESSFGVQSGSAPCFTKADYGWQETSFHFNVPGPTQIKLTLNAGNGYPLYGIGLDNTSLLRIGDSAPAHVNPPGNLMHNPGFEEGLSGWEKSETMNGSIGNLLPHSGHKYGNFSPKYNSTGAFLSQQITIPQTGIYEFSAYLKSVSWNPRSVTVLIKAGNKTEKKTFLPSRNWEKITFSYTAAAASAVTIEIQSDANSSFQLDDVHLIKTQDLPPPAVDNLLTNSSFETGMTNWSQHGTSPNAFIVNTQALTGLSSVCMAYFTSEGLNNCITQELTAPKAGTYTFTAYIKTDPSLSGVGAMITLDALGADGSVLQSKSGAAMADSSGGWKQISVSLPLPQGTQKLVAKIGGVYCTGAFYVDDATLTYAP